MSRYTSIYRYLLLPEKLINQARLILGRRYPPPLTTATDRPIIFERGGKEAKIGCVIRIIGIERITKVMIEGFLWMGEGIFSI